MATQNQQMLHKTPDGAICRQMVKCGKATCKCAQGELHGPYYAYFWREGGRLHKRYLRKAEGEARWQHYTAIVQQRRTLRLMEQFGIADFRALAHQLREVGYGGNYFNA